MSFKLNKGYFNTKNNVIKNKFGKKIEKLGTERIAYYVSSSSWVSVNDKSIFYIEYQYKNDNNELITSKTSSKYSYEEVEYYKFLGEFKIKEYKGKSTITEIIDLERMYKELEQKAKEETEKQELLKKELEVKQCVYCGSKISIQDKKCPNCGSTKFEKTEN